MKVCILSTSLQSVQCWMLSTSVVNTSATGSGSVRHNGKLLRFGEVCKGGVVYLIVASFSAMHKFATDNSYSPSHTAPEPPQKHNSEQILLCRSRSQFPQLSTTLKERVMRVVIWIFRYIILEKLKIFSIHSAPWLTQGAPARLRRRKNSFC